MAGYGYILDSLRKKACKEHRTNWMTVGKVVDNNDPQQMGRLRVYCPGYGDKPEFKIKNIGWATYISPLAGVTSAGTRGPEEIPVIGPTAYGLWSVPEVGAYVLVGCVDGRPDLRFWAGCVQPQFYTHTMPHGRYLWDEPGGPEGPLDSFENQLEPLYGKIAKQFTKSAGEKYPPGTPANHQQSAEWQTRGIDYQTSAITNDVINHEEDSTGTEKADFTVGEFFEVLQPDGTTRTVKGPGYTIDRVAPDDEYSKTGNKNYQSTVHSWTTPGFHSLSMDDRPENARVRIRTTSGHQIIMDDSNERIYINTAGGETWIELDSVGNIDVYASKNISTHAEGDINFFADNTIRMQGKKGVHIQSDDEVRIHAEKDVSVRSEENIRTHSKLSTHIESDVNLHIKTSSTLYLQSEGGDTNILAGGNIKNTATNIHHNSSGGNAADAATAAEEKEAYWTSRVPEHEPWGRVFMKKSKADLDKDNSHETEYAYDDKRVNRGSDERSETYNRPKPNWHR